jgi:hypothetical protein
MLTLKARPRTKLKCPRHPRQKYELDGPAHQCPVCRQIAYVLLCSKRLDSEERGALGWIARTSLAKKAAS